MSKEQADCYNLINPISASLHWHNSEVAQLPGDAGYTASQRAVLGQSLTSSDKPGIPKNILLESKCPSPFSIEPLGTGRSLTCSWEFITRSFICFR